MGPSILQIRVFKDLGAIRIQFASAAFYTATAIPMSYTFYLLPAQMREAGHEPQVVGLLSLVYLPYALRVLWAPAADRYAAGDPARFRLIMMLALGGAVPLLLALGRIDPLNDLAAVMLIATALFMLLATGTTALDGYTLAALDEAGRRRTSIWQTAGFTFGGVALGLGALLGEGWSWSVIATGIALATAIAALPVLLMPKKARQRRPEFLASGSGASLLSLLRLPAARRLLLICLLVKGSVGMIAGYLPVLQVDAGVSASQAGFFGAIGSNVLGLGAALASGALLMRSGGWWTLACVCGVAALLFAFAAFAQDAIGGPALAVLLSVSFLSLGYAYVAPFKALSLTICGGSNGASRAALLASVDLTLSIIAASAAGLVVTLLGTVGFFAAGAVLCVAASSLALRSERDVLAPQNSSHS